MTIRDIAIKFGFELDNKSEDKTNKAVDKLKKTSTDTLGEIGVSFKTDSITEQSVLDSVGRIKSEAEKLADNVAGFTVDEKSKQAVERSLVDLQDKASALKENDVGYRVDKKSEADVVKSINNIKSTAKKVLGVIGISFTVVKLATVLKQNEEVAAAIDDVKSRVTGWFREMDKTYGITRAVANGITKGFNQVVKVLRRVQDSFEKIGKRVGGVDRLMKLLAISAGAIFLALNAGKILGFLQMFGKGISKISLKMIAIVAVIIIVALLIEDLINFMQGKDSLMGSLFEKFGIDGDMVRDTINGILNAAKCLLPLLLELTKSVGVMLLGTLKELLPAIIELAKEIIPIVVDTVKELIAVAMEIIKEILPVVINLIKQLIPFVAGIIKQILPVIINLIKTLLPLVMKIIKAVLPIIINLIQQLLPLALSIIQRVLPVIIGLIEKLLPLAMKIIETVLPIIINLIEILIPIVMTIIDAVLPILIGLIEKLLPVAMQIIDAVLPIVISLVELLISVIMPIIDTILPLLMTLLEALIPVITFVAELLGNVLGAAFEGLMPIIDAVMGIFQGLIDFIMGVFTGDWSKAWDAVVSIFKNIIDGIVAVFKMPINIIITGINTFLGGLNKLKIPDWVPGVGGKGINIPLMPMLAKGSGNAPDTFIAGEAGPELITNAKGSNVFTANETVDVFQSLKNIVGLAKAQANGEPQEGVGEGNGDKPSPFGKIVGAAKDIAKFGATPKAETVEAATSSNIDNRAVTQNVEITNQFHGDRAGQENSKKAMDKAADDATGQLARGLAYAK